MANNYNNLIYALYSEFPEIYYNPVNLKDFIKLLSDIPDGFNTKFITNLMKLLNSITNNPKLITLSTFQYSNYKPTCDKINEVITKENEFISENKLSTDKTNDYNNIMKILLLSPGNIERIENIANIVLNYQYDTDTDEKNFDINKFITAYNHDGKTILNILDIVSEYNLYKYISISDNYDELKILSELLKNVLNNPKLLNVSKYKDEIINIIRPIIDQLDYSTIANYINKTEIYKNIIVTDEINFNDTSDALIANNIITENDKNLFNYISQQIKISDDDVKTLSEMNIKIDKSNTLVYALRSLNDIEPFVVYDSENLNIQDIYTIISKYIKELFNKVTEYNKLGSVVDNICNGKPIKEILILFNKNINVITRLTTNKRPITEFAEELSKNLFGESNNLYNDNVTDKDKNILINICNIYNPDGKLNTTYLEKIFKDYINVLYLIFSKFDGSDLNLLYRAAATLPLKESENVIMFKNRILFEDIAESDVNAKSFGENIIEIDKDAEDNNKSFKEICVEKVGETPDESEKTQDSSLPLNSNNNVTQNVVDNAKKLKWPDTLELDYIPEN